MRGKHVSRTIEDLVVEAAKLAAKGVKELILISQELTYYGLDIYEERAISKLLEELVKIDGIEWIRLHYTYPGKFPMDLIDTMAKHDKICNYLDIPLQHTTDNILKKMKRFATKKDAIDIIKYAREKIPDIAIRTTFIVGFPGETDEDFEELLEFIREMRFDRVGVFEYSHEEDTAAFEMEDDVPEEAKKYRASTLMAVQREISYENNLNKTGSDIRVIIDRQEGDYYVGRSQYDSPEVDNEVLIKTDKIINPGDFVNVKITDAEEYDLFGIIK
jgi:ribosomal protein S12 methylthiotransferase